ncbi:prolipoprotein diacylglyceryl transferase [Candidatus Atelocyanobacterium thalassae]|uniref:Phosphatidylglycerol--prolipoprotein diacylglyceryl transferase n=1 Tax=cyanobacterium endosymbiont of Braarudosphaera bigelowii TaxID=1285375 RepID=A0ABM7U4N1_9CHRO|nr:prolipoprotein diacylglyceryl transferase [Candidatus Atelocyanobacterium thalassa]BDA39681.1 prolipoprotein diacylglyceryl transferase [cyanobacterium endosymbiont of Braarudosphaera bigelowii]
MLLGLQFQSPGPIIFELGPFILRWYGFLIASAVLIGITLSKWLAKFRRVESEIISDLAIWIVIAAIPCARIYYVIFQWQVYSQYPEDIIAVWKGGIAIHGAIIGGILSTLIFARLNKTSFWQLTDLVVPSAVLGQSIGRWGNFFNSEAFGTPTNLPWKLYIPLINRPTEYISFEYFHPTFLYESIWDFLVFIILLTLFFFGLKYPNYFYTGTLSLVYLIAYSFGRILIETLRIDSLILGPFRAAQVISLIMIISGIFGLVWLYLLNKSLPDVISHK